jgi:hypothetical protein
MKVPDAIEPAVGYRVWQVEDNQLYSLVHKTLWQPRMVFEAYCAREHDVPDKQCACGVYAALTFNRLYDMGYTKQDGIFSGNPGDNIIAGRVKLWGDLIPGRVGWRAQFAYPEKLLVPYSLARMAKPLSKAYGVPFKLFNTQRKHQRVKGA